MTEPTIRSVAARPLTGEDFAPFGVYAAEPHRDPDWVASGSRVGGVREDRTEHGPKVADLWNIGDLSYDGDVPYVGFVRYYHQGFRVSQLERHPQETQTWIARSGAGLLVVAPASGDGLPTPDSATAFVVEPGDVLAIGRGVWMCHFFPIGRRATYNVITARREPEQDRDLVDFVETTNTILELVLPELPPG